MTKLPRISIVTPCFNHSDFIAATMESVQRQDYSNFEYIVIDDGSTDNSWDVIKGVANSNTHLIQLDGHRPSPVKAINEGFSVASGDVLCWLSSDDILLPGALQSVAEVFSQFHQISWISGKATTIDSRGRLLNCNLRKLHKYDYLSGRWQIIQQESTFFSRSLFERVGSHVAEDFDQAFDTELWTRFFEREKLYFVDAPLGAFRRSEQSRSTTNPTEFRSWNDKAIRQMRERANIIDTVMALFWQLLSSRFAAPLSYLLPERLWVKIFPKFSHQVISYSFRSSDWTMTLKRSVGQCAG